MLWLVGVVNDLRIRDSNLECESPKMLWHTTVQLLQSVTDCYGHRAGHDYLIGENNHDRDVSAASDGEQHQITIICSDVKANQLVLGTK